MLWRGGGALKSDAMLRVLRHITGIATKWNHSARMLGPDVFLDNGSHVLTIEKSGHQSETFNHVITRFPRHLVPPEMP